MKRRCDRADLGCRHPDTHVDHAFWVKARWTGECLCGHLSLEHVGLSPHGCFRCDCRSFYPVGRDISPSREEVLAS